MIGMIGMFHTSKCCCEALGKKPEAAECWSAIYLGDIRQEGGEMTSREYFTIDDALSGSALAAKFVVEPGFLCLTPPIVDREQGRPLNW
eukprot:scaffold41354_cov53-Attheya_sp.AAC.2